MKTEAIEEIIGYCEICTSDYICKRAVEARTELAALVKDRERLEHLDSNAPHETKRTIEGDKYTIWYLDIRLIGDTFRGAVDGDAAMETSDGPAKTDG